jgi:hypothetical protein
LKFIEPNMKTIITPNHKIRLYIETEKQEAKKSSVPNQLIFFIGILFSFKLSRRNTQNWHVTRLFNHKVKKSSPKQEQQHHKIV